MRQIFLIGWLTGSCLLNGQMTLSGNSELRFGESQNGYNYSETHLSFNSQIKNISVWGQFEFSSPPELGKPYSGLRKFRMEYESGPVQVKVGDVYEFWGSGLVLNQFDDQSIDFDNGVRGLLMNYSGRLFEGKILAGKATILKSHVNVGNFDDRIHNYQLNHSILGADLTVPFRNFSIGYSYLQTREEHPLPPDTLNLLNFINGGRLTYLGDRIDFFAEYADNRIYQDFSDSTVRINGGHALFANMNIFLGDWTASIDYKRYRFLDLNPIYRSDFVYHYGRITDFQQPPIGINEFTSTLQNRLIHQVDFNSEQGYQIELTGPLTDRINLTFHFARASRTHRWTQNSSYTWANETVSTMLPSDDKTTSPVQEMSVLADGFLLNDLLHFIVAFNTLNDNPLLVRNILTDTTSRLMYESVDGVSLPISLDYTFPKGWSVGISAEYQIVTKFYHREETLNGSVTLDSSISLFPTPEQFNRYFALTVGKSPNWSVTLSLDNISAYQFGSQPDSYQTSELEKLFKPLASPDNSWIAIDFVYNLTPTHRLSVMYGSLQGGLVCSNGVCRVIDPFEDGLKLTLTSMF